jgi:hypothetical protein
LEWIIFSPLGLFETNNGNDLSITEYALNIQCTWRIIGPEGIVVASNDLYFPAGEYPYHDLETFDWAVQGSNRCDERTNLFKKSIADQTLIVLSVEADSLGGLSIYLSEGYSIDIFPADSLGREYWRFFNRNSTDNHFVVTGEGIEESSD